MFDALPNSGFSNHLRPPERPNDDAPLPPRFSLLALFAISTGAAIYCGMLRLFGVYGVMLMLAGLVALYCIQVQGPWRAVKRVVTDMLAGIVLPIGCLAFDPVVFRTPGGGGVFGLTEQVFIYALLGSEMLVLFVWLLVGGAFNRLGRSLTAGVLTLGWLICFALGLLLSLLGFGALALGEPIGLLGIVPWFTLATYWSNARRANTSPRGQPSIFGGRLLGVGLLLMVATMSSFGAWLVAPNGKAIPAAKLGALWELQSGGN